MLKNLDIQEKLIELGAYRHNNGKVEIVKELNENIVIFDVEKKGFGLASQSGQIVLQPYFRRIVKLSDEILLLENEHKRFGAFDINSCCYLAPCKYDYVEICEFEDNKVEYVDFYEGVNSYTLGVNTQEHCFFLNPHISEHMLKVLNKNPENFMNLNSAYFRDRENNFSENNTEILRKSAIQGFGYRTKTMLKMDFNTDVIDAYLDAICEKIEKKIEIEKSKTFDEVSVEKEAKGLTKN